MSITMAILLAVLYSVGFYLIMQRALMRVLLGIVILGHAANLFLQTSSGPPAAPAFVGSGPAAAMTDPLPQALALTAIVITFGLTTFLLALSYRSRILLGHDEVQDDIEDSRISAAADAEEADTESGEEARR